ncbi:MAG: sigma-70 family RNA polymerase sigma factor [Clostridia bacterium]|nr:sigma-70 family RNA polymerase sigma factor [Clostridia bacterium]
MSREEFICQNLGLVHTCARRFAGRGIEYDDLYQAGCVGLIKAADGFDPDRGLCFSTYAVPLILGEMRHLFREGGAVKVSRSMKALSLKASRLREQLASLHGREPTVEELATAMEVEPTVAAQAIAVGMAPLSLTRWDEDTDEQLDLPTPSPEEQITDRLALEQLLAQLEPRDRQLIRLRYLGRQTQQATAKRLGMTQVQVSRREKALLLSLREKLTV